LIRKKEKGKRKKHIKIMQRKRMKQKIQKSKPNKSILATEAFLND